MASVRVCALACLLALLGAALAQDKYDEGRFASINLDEVLGNQRILTAFIKCFLEQGPCTADAKDMKKLLPEVIDSMCTKCTNNQKKMMARAVDFVRSNRPSDWELLVNKYNPNNAREAELDQFIKEAMAL